MSNVGVLNKNSLDTDVVDGLNRVSKKFQHLKIAQSSSKF
jgi:hypothetical protein